jgi:hypothetical protein
MSRNTGRVRFLPSCGAKRRRNGRSRQCRLLALPTSFELGVNFIESVVNRHRIEVYVLDDNGPIAVSFERLHWDEALVVDRAVKTLSRLNQD